MTNDERQLDRLAVLVVSYRRADLLDACLTSVAKHLAGAHVLVWDNRSEHSADIRDLATRLAPTCAGPSPTATSATRRRSTRWPSRLLARICCCSTRTPNSPARYKATRAALRGEFVAAVSPTVAATLGGERPWDIARRKQTVVRAAGRRGRLRGPVARQGSCPTGTPRRRPRSTATCPAAACWSTASVWDELRGFDERFFLYGEESEWQRRAREAGWRLLLVDEPDVRHASGGTTAGRPARVASRHRPVARRARP